MDVEKSEKEKQSHIDKVFNIAYEHYEKARSSEDEKQKDIDMEIFYINFLKPVFDVLNEERGVKVISVERYAVSSDENNNVSYGYAASYINKDDVRKETRNAFKYKSTALMKLLALFTSTAGTEKVTN